MLVAGSFAQQKTRRRRGRAPLAPLLLTPHFGRSRPIDRLPLRRVKILGASRVLCYICSLSERLSMTASAEAIPQCHAAVRGHEKVGSSEILVTPKPSSPRAERGVAKDAPGSANEAASWTILRDAMPRIAPSGRGWSHMDPCLAVVFFAASACKALISPVSRSGIAIFCNFLQLSEASKTGEMQLSASFCSKLQASASPFRARAVVQAPAFAARLTSRPEMAPQALEKAQNAPGNGARRRPALCSRRVA